MRRIPQKQRFGTGGRDHNQPRRLIPLWAFYAVLMFSAGCQRSTVPESETVQDLIETEKAHAVTVRLKLTPGVIDPRKDALLHMQISHPSNLQVTYPEISTKLEGFYIAATLSSPDNQTDGERREQETTIRLTPIPGQSYRIAPILFTIDTGDDTESKYLLTPAMRPDVLREDYGETPALSSQPDPLYIAPTGQEIALWLFLALAFLATVAALFVIGRKLKERIRIMRLSPSERAKYELTRLLEQDLPGKGQYKEFYFAITSIIRTYIERQHGIRAPELTTSEFLDAATNKPEFDRTVVEKLKKFLESADLVKFAAWMPTPKAVEETIHTAQEYLTEDASKMKQGGV